MLAVTGMALCAGLAFGGAPAMASSSSATTTTVKLADLNPARTVGYYPTRWACERAGQRGERFGSWDDYDCYRSGWGFRDGGWVLDVSYGWSDWNDWNGWNDHRGGHHGDWFPGGDHRRWDGRGDRDRRDGDRRDGDRRDGDRRDGDNSLIALRIGR
jgi:hypothetical protein